MFRTLLAVPAAVLAFGISAHALEDRVLELPGDYSSSYDNYYVSDRLYQDDQVISLFANDVVRDAARAGQPLPDGSIIVGEIYAAKKDAEGDVVESPLGRRIAGELKAIVMMERRAVWADQYPEGNKVGGWEFEVFSPDGKNLGKDTTACRECHEPLADSDYTWSLDHIAAAN